MSHLNPLSFLSQARLYSSGILLKVQAPDPGDSVFSDTKSKLLQLLIVSSKLITVTDNGVQIYCFIWLIWLQRWGDAWDIENIYYICTQYDSCHIYLAQVGDYSACEPGLFTLSSGRKLLPQVFIQLTLCWSFQSWKVQLFSEMLKYLQA